MNKIPKLLQKSLKEKDKFYFITHLEIINSFFPIKLTPKEIIFLASFMVKEGKRIENDRFCTLIRKEVKEELGISDGGMGNYIRSLVDKGAIKKNEETGKLYINVILFPNKDKQYYQFKLERDNQDVKQ